MGLAAIAATACLLSACERPEDALEGLQVPAIPERIERPRSASNTAARRPNLVLVSIDTLRADHLSTYGYERRTSPGLDRFASEAVLFEQAFSHSPKTAPSHMSLMTGLLPEAHRVQNRFADTSTWLGQLSDDVPTLAEILRAAGYQTSARTGGGNMHGDIGFARGFASYESPGWAGPQIFRSAIAELERLAGDPAPFFLLVHTYQVHAPYLPPERFRKHFVAPDYDGAILGDAQALTEITGSSLNDIHTEFWRRVDRDSPEDQRHLRDLYDACIRFVDAQVGALLARIDALDLRDETIVVVLSDHGEQFGEHGGFEHAELWRELLHVPLVMRVPSTLRSGWGPRRLADPVGLVDVLPTLLELMEVPRPAHLQGRSLVGMVETRAQGPAWVFSQNRETGDVALRADRWKLLRSGDGDQLFDLAEDPDEHRDAAAEHGSVRDAALRHVRAVLSASQGYWPLVREGRPTEIDADTRRRLEALGYIDRTDQPSR